MIKEPPNEGLSVFPRINILGNSTLCVPFSFKLTLTSNIQFPRGAKPTPTVNY